MTATLKTSRGEIVVRLLPDHAPMAVKNFVELAEGTREWAYPDGEETTERLYDGTLFHRVIGEFMVQGGSPEGTGNGGPFADEYHPDLAFSRPYLMATADNFEKNSNGSQFSISAVADPALSA
nr:peptidylprolyl isomerase [Streptomyces sp. SID4948]